MEIYIKEEYSINKTKIKKLKFLQNFLRILKNESTKILSLFRISNIWAI